MLPTNFFELFMDPFAFLPLVEMVLVGNCLACVEMDWAGDVACGLVTPDY
jgi:hypothetical protein